MGEQNWLFRSLATISLTKRSRTMHGYAGWYHVKYVDTKWDTRSSSLVALVHTAAGTLIGGLSESIALMLRTLLFREAFASAMTADETCSPSETSSIAEAYNIISSRGTCFLMSHRRCCSWLSSEFRRASRMVSRASRLSSSSSTARFLALRRRPSWPSSYIHSAFVFEQFEHGRC